MNTSGASLFDLVLKLSPRSLLRDQDDCSGGVAQVACWQARSTTAESGMPHIIGVSGSTMAVSVKHNVAKQGTDGLDLQTQVLLGPAAECITGSVPGCYQNPSPSAHDGAFYRADFQVTVLESREMHAASPP